MVTTNHRPVIVTTNFYPVQWIFFLQAQISFWFRIVQTTNSITTQHDGCWGVYSAMVTEIWKSSVQEWFEQEAGRWFQEWNNDVWQIPPPTWESMIDVKRGVQMKQLLCLHVFSCGLQDWADLFSSLWIVTAKTVKLQAKMRALVISNLAFLTAFPMSSDLRGKQAKTRQISEEQSSINQTTWNLRE